MAINQPNVQIHPLSAEEILYAVYCDDELTHIGESESIARAGAYVQNRKRESRGKVTAAYVEVTSEVRALFEMPASVTGGCLFRGNLERLLQAAYFWRHGKLPREDNSRGGKGVAPTATGGFVRSVHVLPEVFALLDRICPPASGAEPWPTVNLEPAESIDPVVQVGRGRPGNRQRHLAFWVDFASREVLVGHLPVLSNAPQYGAASAAVVWRKRHPG